jgi:programmed cell death protein 5
MNQEEQMQLQQQVQQLEIMVKQKMTKQALERFGNIKSAHPEKAIQVLAVLGQAIQTGKLEEIEDDQLKEILMKLTPEKKEFKIKRM